MQNHQSQNWNTLYTQGRDFQLITSKEIDTFLSHTSENAPKTCLDIGCGTGQLTRELYHRGYSVFGIDASSSAISRAKQLTTVDDSRLTYRVFDIEHDDINTLPTFSLITVKLVYAFMKDKPTFLDNLTKLLNSDGRVVIITPMVDDVEPAKRAIAITSEELVLLETRFSKIDIYKERGLTYFIGSPF